MNCILILLLLLCSGNQGCGSNNCSRNDRCGSDCGKNDCSKNNCSKNDRSGNDCDGYTSERIAPPVRTDFPSFGRSSSCDTCGCEAN